MRLVTLLAFYGLALAFILAFAPATGWVKLIPLGPVGNIAETPRP